MTVSLALLLYSDPVTLTLLNVEGSVGGQWQSHLVSSILRLLCEEYRPQQLPGRAGSPYCVVEEEVEVEVGEMCRNCSWYVCMCLFCNLWVVDEVRTFGS